MSSKEGQGSTFTATLPINTITLLQKRNDPAIDHYLNGDLSYPRLDTHRPRPYTSLATKARGGG
jgi:hypothetical protein